MDYSRRNNSTDLPFVRYHTLQQNDPLRKGRDESHIVFIYNADSLDAVHIDPDTGDMYPDLPREIWNG